MYAPDNAASAAISIATLPKDEKLKMAIEKTMPKLPSEVREQLAAFIEPESLAIMLAILTAWAVSHFFGVGELADAVLLTVGYVALGGVAVQAGQALYDFGRKALNAQSETDLDQSADCLARAITLIGIQAVMALLLKRFVFKNGYKNGRTFKDTFWKEPLGYQKGKRIEGKWFHKNAKIKYERLDDALGGTDMWGDITIEVRAIESEKAAARFHERVHQILTPKLYLLRNMRANLSIYGYNRSYLLRYLEEALAETYSQLRMNGFRGRYLLSGIRFPIGSNGYKVTVTALRQETTGILFGGINVGGMAYRVYYGFCSPREGRK